MKDLKHNTGVETRGKAGLLASLKPVSGNDPMIIFHALYFV
jgi:hypothetical protein